MQRLVPTSQAAMPLALSAGGFSGFAQPEMTASSGDLWRILRHRKGLIATTAALLFAAALAYGLLTPPLFTASSEIIVDPRERQVMGNDINGVAPDGGIIQVESQVQVIQSSSVLLRAIAATDLMHDPEFNGKGSLSARLMALWDDSPVAAAVTGMLPSRLIAMRPVRAPAPSLESQTETAALRMLQRRLAVTRAEKVFVIGVSVTANTADKAARLANAIADAYLVDQAETRARSGQTAASALTGRLEQQRKRVEELDNEIQTYRKSNDILTANGSFVGEQKLIDFTAQLTAAQSRTAALRAKIDQLRQPNSSTASTPEAMQSPVISRLREQESILVQREVEVGSRLGPNYPTMGPVQAQLASIRQMIAAELNRILSSIQGDYSRALIDEQLLTVAVERAKTETAAVRQASVKLRELERDLEANRSVHATFLARAHETSEQVGIDAPSARIITRAIPPAQQSWPPLGLLLVGAIGSGIGLGSGFALIREYVRPTILSRDQVERDAGAPVVGILPGGALTGGRYKLSPGIARSKANPGSLAIIGLALRRLFNLDNASTLRDGIGVRSLLITSSAPDADVRREICNLFATAAKMRGDRVLLVDADVAGVGGKPEKAPGLLDVLNGENTLSSLIDLAPSTGIAFLGKGRGRHSLALAERSWNGATRLLQEATPHFDMVIFDGGEMSENLRIAPVLTAVGEVLLVGQLARTTQNNVLRAADAAMVMGRPISAVFLVDPIEQS